MTLAEQIIKFRALEGISQKGLAAKIGVCSDMILRIENGRRVSRRTETKIEKFLEENNCIDRSDCDGI